MTTRPFVVPSFYVVEPTVLVPEVTFSNYRQWECPTCGTYPGHRIGHTAVHFVRKRDVADFVPTARGLLGCSSAVECLLGSDISGWRQGRVEITATPKLATLPLDYSEIVVIGHALNYAKEAGLIVKFECQTCGRQRFERPSHGLPMPASSWDKSDLFRIEEMGMILATEQTRIAVEACGLTGIQFTPVDDWHDPLYMIGGNAP